MLPSNILLFEKGVSCIIEVIFFEISIVAGIGFPPPIVLEISEYIVDPNQIEEVRTITAVATE